MSRRSTAALTAAAAVAAVLGGAATPALAATTAPAYPVLPEPVTVRPGAVEVGQPVVFTGLGYSPRATVDLTTSWEGTPPARVLAERAVRHGGADKAGRFTQTVVPDRVGTLVLVSVGRGASGTVKRTATVTVLPKVDAAAAASPGSLPRTGPAGLGTELWVALGLVVVGGGVFAASRSHRGSRD